MPLRVIGGLSHDESQLLGIEMGVFGETIMNTACYGQELQPSTFMSKLFGLSTGQLPSLSVPSWTLVLQLFLLIRRDPTLSTSSH